MAPQKYDIQITVATQYVEMQSDPAASRYVFAYTITIANTGEVTAQLINRHWLITDAGGHVQEVRGAGVVGEQPMLEPGTQFQYTSGAVLETPFGTMQGSYEMLAADGVRFDAPIPAFRLAVPNMLH